MHVSVAILAFQLVAFMQPFEVTELIGVPFVDGGREVTSGLDCWGLVLEIFRRHGIRLPDYKISADDCERIACAIEEEQETGKWIRHEYPAVPVPAIIVLRYNKPTIWNHTGVYLGGGRFIHTREKVGVVIERVESPMWRRRIEGFYTPKQGWIHAVSDFAVSAATGDLSGGYKTT